MRDFEITLIITRDYGQREDYVHFVQDSVYFWVCCAGPYFRFITKIIAYILWFKLDMLLQVVSVDVFRRLFKKKNPIYIYIVL